MPQPQGPWDDALIAELRTLRAAGYNAREIAVLLGNNLTRNAVIGKAWRLRIPWGDSKRSPPTERKPVARATPRPDPPRPPKPPAPPPPPPQSPPQPQAAPPMRGRRLLDLEAHHCRWPLGGLYDRPTHFCANDKVEHTPYCSTHNRIAYNRPRTAA